MRTWSHRIASIHRFDYSILLACSLTRPLCSRGPLLSLSLSVIDSHGKQMDKIAFHRALPFAFYSRATRSQLPLPRNFISSFYHRFALLHSDFLFSVILRFHTAICFTLINHSRVFSDFRACVCTIAPGSTITVRAEAVFRFYARHEIG